MPGHKGLGMGTKHIFSASAWGSYLLSRDVLILCVHIEHMIMMGLIGPFTKFRLIYVGSLDIVHMML